MANLWSKAVGIIHRQKFLGQPLQAAMKSPETKELYEKLKGNAGKTGKVYNKGKFQKKGKKSRKNRKTRRHR
jgi:hypothetical protein